MKTGNGALSEAGLASLVVAEEGEGQSGRIDLTEALGETLEAFREYLLRVADRGLGRDLTAKIGASDLVQETFMAAQRSVAAFRGQSEAEWRAWLESILRHRLANARRYYRDAGKRCVGQEVPLDADPGCSGAVAGAGAWAGFVAASETVSTASVGAMRKEREIALFGAIASLPENYRLVVCWHHEERLTFEQIADRLGTTAEAARKIWGRALLRLREALGSAHDPR
jgi:RNA polymerase sigma-70 factor (ECF subfamily)